jgi:hypothetical protein
MASSDLPLTHGVRFVGTAFFVVHRRREYGPFDYHWGADLRSVDLTYRGVRFGEVWSAAQMFVDLREFRLPQRVVQVAVLVSGCLLHGLHRGDTLADRLRHIAAVLRQFGCGRFASSLTVEVEPTA